jgi:hypothetical protein
MLGNNIKKNLYLILINEVWMKLSIYCKTLLMIPFSIFIKPVLDPIRPIMSFRKRYNVIIMRLWYHLSLGMCGSKKYLLL